MTRIRRYPTLASEIVGRSHRDDPKRYVVSVQPIDDFVHRSVATDGRDDVDAATRGVRRHRRRLARFERRQRLHEMALLTYPLHEMSELGTVVARAVDDQCDMLGAHASV